MKNQFSDDFVEKLLIHCKKLNKSIISFFFIRKWSVEREERCNLQEKIVFKNKKGS